MQHRYVCAQLALVRTHGRLVEDRGATAVEYAIMLGFIAAVIVVSVALLGNATNSGFSKVVFP